MTRNVPFPTPCNPFWRRMCRRLGGQHFTPPTDRLSDEEEAAIAEARRKVGIKQGGHLQEGHRGPLEE